jgi:N-formylglutamate amidohydrolase
MRPQLLRLSLPGALLALPLGLAPLGQEAKAPAGLLATQEGELPIILSAPHGGEAAVPGVLVRKGEGLPKGPAGFFTTRDVGTEQLALKMAAAIEAKMGKKPYYVVARFHRKYVDANRPSKLGYEGAKAKPVYDAYHDALNRYCRDVKKKFGRGLLLDIHGQGKAADTVFRGTKDGKTVTLLVQRFGAKAHDGPKSFSGLLAAAGLKAHPQDGERERAGLTGGYIVQAYGSHTAHGIDAMQLEFGGNHRTNAKVKDTADKMAGVVAAFAKLYLTDRPS